VALQTYAVEVLCVEIGGHVDGDDGNGGEAWDLQAHGHDAGRGGLLDPGSNGRVEHGDADAARGATLLVRRARKVDPEELASQRSLNEHLGCVV
jgi:hypothetical protein